MPKVEWSVFEPWLNFRSGYPMGGHFILLWFEYQTGNQMVPTIWKLEVYLSWNKMFPAFGFAVFGSLLYMHISWLVCRSTKFFQIKKRTLLTNSLISIPVNSGFRRGSLSPTSVFPNRQTFRFPSAVNLSRLHVPQKFSVMEVMKPTCKVVQ
jgi:hypothetical protein